KQRDRLFETNEVASQRLGQIAINFNRVDPSFVYGPQDFPEETDGRLFLKFASHMEAATVVKEHDHANSGFRARYIAKRPRLAVDPKLEVFQFQIDDGITTLINYRNRNGDKVGTDANNVVRINFIGRFLRCRNGRWRSNNGSVWIGDWP